MTPFQIFGLQFALSFILYFMVVKRYVMPKLLSMPALDAFIVLAFTQVFRYIGLIFLVPGVVSGDLPQAWAGPVAYGDLATTVLALITIVLLWNRSRAGVAMLWLTNIVGLIDLLNALFQGASINVSVYLNAAWYIPTFVVPALLVFHWYIFKMLIKRGKESF
jgi:hypothetical protein